MIISPGPDTKKILEDFNAFLENNDEALKGCTNINHPISYDEIINHGDEVIKVIQGIPSRERSEIFYQKGKDS